MTTIIGFSKHKKPVLFVIAFAVLLVLFPALGECNSENVMTHEEFIEAELNDPVCVTAYIQFTLGNNTQAFVQSPDGAYYLYNMACSKEEIQKLVPGTKIRVNGIKSEFNGQLYIEVKTLEFVDGDIYIADAFDATDLLGKDELIHYQNGKVLFKGLRVEPMADGAAVNYRFPTEKRGIIRFCMSKNGKVYEFTCDEWYPEVYKSIENLHVGDIIDIVAFLDWRNNNPAPLITEVLIQSKGEDDVVETANPIGTIWSLSENDTLIISGNGAMEVPKGSRDGWREYGSTIKNAVIKEGITTIGDKAFENNVSLKSVIIPESVTSIGAKAFSYCTLLQSVSLPKSLITIEDGAFANCHSLESVSIPENVTSIGYRAFDYCTSLISVMLPESLISIGDAAFTDCHALTSISIPSGVTSIGHNAFANCDALQSVVIPDGVTSLQEGTFSSCDSLVSVTIPESVTSIGDYAFYGSSLQSIVIPDGVTSIGKEAFSFCKSLVSATIPKSVTSLGEKAFYGCKSLQSVYIFDGVTCINEGVFSDCSTLEYIVIPENVTYIHEDEFKDCYCLTAVVCEDSYAQHYCEDHGISYKTVVSAKKAGLTVNSKDGSSTITAGKTMQMIAAFENPDLINKKAKNDDVNWSVVNAATGETVQAVTINTNGLLKTDKSLDMPVELLVKATSVSFGTEASVKIIAIPVVRKMQVDPAELFFYAGVDEPQTVSVSLEPASVPPIGLTWTSANRKLIEIEESEAGTVSIKALEAGKTTIMVKEPGGKTASVKVNIVAPVESVELKVNGKPKAGGKVNIVPTLYPKNAGNKAVQYSLDVGEDVASINEKGQLSISETVLSGTRITVTCMALGTPSFVSGTIVVEIP